MIFYNIHNKLFDTNIASEDCERSINGVISLGG